MTWTKLTEDKTTWPEKAPRYCWIRLEKTNLVLERAFTFDPDFEVFWTMFESTIHSFEMSRVSYWAPAAPPPFEEPDNA